MTDRRQIYETDQRRQVSSKIDQLKSNCDELTQLKASLSNRLSMLTDTVDKLIEEKISGKRDPNLKIELPHSSRGRLFQHNSRETGTIPKSLSSGNIDLANDDKQLSKQPTYPSDTFKIKFYHCLKEILPKAEGISRLSEQIFPTD